MTADGLTTRRSSRAWERRFQLLLALADLVGVGVAIGVTFVTGLVPLTDGLWAGAGDADDLAVACGVVALWPAMLALSGAYDIRVIGLGAEEYKRVAVAGVRAFALGAAGAFVANLALAPDFAIVAATLVIVLTIGARQVVRKRVHRQRARGRYVRRLLVVGAEVPARDLIRHLWRAPFAGYEVVAASVPGASSALDVDGREVVGVGPPDTLLDALDRLRADAVALADSETIAGEQLRRLAWALEGTGVDLIVAPAVTDVAGPRIAVRPVAGLPLLHVDEPELTGTQRFVKSVFDRVAALLLLVIVAPLLAVIAVAIRVSGGGPALFRQTRVGRNGREFRMVKFRTMAVGAEEEVERLAAENEGPGVLFKLRDDPRTTRLGRRLRRHSLDELPQLWNVAGGHMSMVGPRPPLPAEVARYPAEMHRRLLVKPGMTGLWQVSGRSELTWEETMRVDLTYVENWSLALDLQILWRTLPVVLRGTGAY